MRVFSSLHPTLQELLLTGLGWDDLRPVQVETYLSVSSGADTQILAPTAGGKTESAFFPVIDGILKNPSDHLSVIYISPLKALINDQLDRIQFMCSRTGLGAAVQHGDISARDRFDFSGFEHADILLTTPESLEVLLSDSRTRRAFADVRYLIIDEIHAFMESDRGVHLRFLMDRLDMLGTQHITRVGLSAILRSFSLGSPDRTGRNILFQFLSLQQKNSLRLWWNRSFQDRCMRSQNPFPEKSSGHSLTRRVALGVSASFLCLAGRLRGRGTFI